MLPSLSPHPALKQGRGLRRNPRVIYKANTAAAASHDAARTAVLLFVCVCLPFYALGEKKDLGGHWECISEPS